MKYIFLLILLLFFKVGFAQDASKQFIDFTIAISAGEFNEAMALTKDMNLESSNLSNRKKAIIYFKTAAYYENSKKNIDETIGYYEKCLKYEPNYFVPHLALGYLFLNKANEMSVKINNERGNIALRNKYIAEYKANLKNALPHFEKAMACDPNDQVLTSIKKVCGALKDTDSLSSLDSKLVILRKECIDFLSED